MNEAGESGDGNFVGLLPVFNPLASSSSVILTSDNESESIPSSQSSVTAFVGSDVSAEDICLGSICKTTNDKPKRSVHFADGQNQALVTYQEPSPDSVWNGVQTYTIREIIGNYTKACSKAHTVVQDSIVNQLQEIRNNEDFSATLNLTDLTLDADVIDTLESIFRMVTFRTICLDKCVSPHATDIFDMLEFYNPVKELVLTEIEGDDTNMWHSMANAISNSDVLFSASFREMLFDDTQLRILFEKGINYSNNIKKVRFDACGLSRAPTFMLAHYLKHNDYLRELHLCYLDLYSKEAEILGKFLTRNNSLRVLNVSNNKLGDHGFQVLSYGLFDQAEKGIGVEVLILFNNKLTKRCVDTLDTIISSCPIIHTINVGMNELTDIVIYATKESLARSVTLRALGLQSTLITSQGLVEFAEACEKNTSLRHLNLRGNKAFQPDSLNCFANVIHNTSLIQIDLDDNNRTCFHPEVFTEIVNKVRQVLAVNKAKLEEENPDENQKWIQERFLTCEPTYVPKSVMQAKRSSYSHRFSIAEVSEKSSPPRRVSHRFTVVPSTSAAGGDTGNTYTDARETCKHPTAVESATSKSNNINAGGDSGSSMSQDLINRNDCDVEPLQSLPKKTRSVITNIDEESPMEVEEDKITIITTDESKSSSDNESSKSNPAANANVANSEEQSSMKVEGEEENTGGSAPLTDGNTIHTGNESPISVDDEMDTTDDIVVADDDTSSKDDSDEGN